jgi:hypothetical protein
MEKKYDFGLDRDTVLIGGTISERVFRFVDEVEDKHQEGESDSDLNLSPLFQDCPTKD